MDLYEKYSTMANLEFRARQIFNKVCYNRDHHLETNKQEIENALQQIQSIMLLDSFNYRAYYYKSKCHLAEGEELLKWAYEAIVYFERQYFKHESIISHFKALIVKYYIDNDALIEAYSVLQKAIKETSIGSYAWFKYMFSYIELLAKEGKFNEAAEKLELITNHEVFASLAEYDRQHWDVLCKLVYDDKTVKQKK